MILWGLACGSELAMCRTVESASLDTTSAGRSERAIHLSSVHDSGLLPTERQLQRSEYLLRMTPAGLESYRRALHEAFEITQKIQHELGRICPLRPPCKRMTSSARRCQQRREGR